MNVEEWQHDDRSVILLQRLEELEEKTYIGRTVS